jgi:hypothetical protein
MDKVWLASQAAMETQGVASGRTYAMCGGLRRDS